MRRRARKTVSSVPVPRFMVNRAEIRAEDAVIRLKPCGGERRKTGQSYGEARRRGQERVSRVQVSSFTKCPSCTVSLCLQFPLSLSLCRSLMRTCALPPQNFPSSLLSAPLPQTLVMRRGSCCILTSCTMPVHPSAMTCLDPPAAADEDDDDDDLYCARSCASEVYHNKLQNFNLIASSKALYW